MSDNEHTPSSLRHSPSKAVHSHKLSVQHSVGETIPAFCQPSEDGGESSPAVQREHTGDVLPYDPLGAKAPSKATKFERQVATLIIQSRSETRDREGLARGSPDENIDSCIVALADGCEIPVKRNVWVMVLQYGARKRINLG